MNILEPGCCVAYPVWYTPEEYAARLAWLKGGKVGANPTEATEAAQSAKLPAPAYTACADCEQACVVEETG